MIFFKLLDYAELLSRRSRSRVLSWLVASRGHRVDRDICLLLVEFGELLPQFGVYFGDGFVGVGAWLAARVSSRVRCWERIAMLV